jgi:hypothetical protein
MTDRTAEQAENDVPEAEQRHGRKQLQIIQ